MTKRITVSLPDGVHDVLAAYAARTGFKVSTVVLKALAAYAALKSEKQ